MRAEVERIVCAVVALFSIAAFASAAEVWPSKVKRLEDGRVEYGYDLRPLKAPSAIIDLGADADEPAIAAFKRALPNEAKVVVSPGKAKVRLHAAGGLEVAPLAPSFAKVPEGVFAPGPWDARARRGGVPALHPDAPKLLPSADVLFWRQQLFQDQIEAGLRDALQHGGAGLSQGRGALFTKVLAAAAERAKSTGGDSQLGARRLAARIAALSSLQTGKLPEAARADPEIASRAMAEAAELSRPKPRFPPRASFTWSRRLMDAHAWELGLSSPFGSDREGVAAVLTLLAILEADPPLAKSYEALTAYRDAAFAKPAQDRLADFRAALGDGGAAGALERMGEFFTRLGFESLQMKKAPGLFAEAQTPVQRFIAGLGAAEQLHAIDELTLAVQDGRVSLEADPAEGWGAGSEPWRRELLRPDASAGVAVSGEYKDRLARTFQALYGLDADMNVGDVEGPAPDEVGDARVRLMVPPHLELEPLADGYERAAQTWARLGKLASSNPKLGAARGMAPDGTARSTTLAKDAVAQEKLMRGLGLVAKAAVSGEGSLSDADRTLRKAALSFLATWKRDAELMRDVRYLLPVGEALEPGTFVHSGILGVGRRELEVSFEGAPDVVVQTKETSLFEADTTAVQRYQVPVLVTGSVTVPRAAPIEQSAFRELCDKSGRTREAINAALPGALVKTMKSVSEGGE